MPNEIRTAPATSPEWGLEFIRREVKVLGWLAAVDGCDLERMLAHLDPAVDFRPLRLPGSGSSYRGHDGVRRWFQSRRRSGHEYRLELTELRPVGPHRVLAVGRIDLVGITDAGPVCGLYSIPGNLITRARHWFTDPVTLGRIGVLSGE